MILLWIGFLALILFLLALDLGLFHRHTHVIAAREALAWTALWVILSLFFNVAIYFIYENHWFGIGLETGHELGGTEAALQYLTGYLVEKSLSLDNIFVIALIFSYFRVPLEFQHRVLFWGILGALVLRGVMIGVGAILIARFDWIIYVFGGLLLVTAIRLFFVDEEEVHPEKNILVNLSRKIFPVTHEIKGSHFFIRENSQLVATPLFLALLTVETSDVAFAIDSIPAIFAITRDPYLVFTSNIFAILGLRSLYFALAALLDRFHHLKYSLMVLLGYIGVKMILSHHFPIPTHVSLMIILGILGVGVAVSVPKRATESSPRKSAPDDETKP